MFSKQTFNYVQTDSTRQVKGYVLRYCGYFLEKGYYKVVHIPSGVRICSFGVTHYTAKSLYKEAAREICNRLSKLDGLSVSDISLIPQETLNQILEIEQKIREEY